jgi:hypothetical protein
MTLKASRQVGIKNSSSSETFIDRDAPLTNTRLNPKPGTHHDSSAVSACLYNQTGNPSKTTNFKSKIPVGKSIVSCPESPLTKPKWNSATRIDQNKAFVDIPSLPGKKKTLKDFVGKHFRATPALPTTHKPSIPVATKKRQSVRVVKKVQYLDPTEKSELLEFEVTEKAILQQQSVQKEITPPRFPKTNPSKEVAISKERALVRRLEEIILREVSKRRTAL